MIRVLAILQLVEVIAAKHTNDISLHKGKLVCKRFNDAFIDTLHSCLSGVVKPCMAKDLTLWGAATITIISHAQEVSVLLLFSVGKERFPFFVSKRFALAVNITERDNFEWFAKFSLNGNNVRWE